MVVDLGAVRKRYRVSTFSEVFLANLLPYEEEGLARHYLHRLPSPLIVERRDQLGLAEPARLCVAFGLVRHSNSDVAAPSEMRKEGRPPFESLYLTLPEGDPPIIPRPQLLEEASRILLDCALDHRRVIVVAHSHRRLIGRSVVLRHYPAAVLDEGGKPIWLHPAAPGYGVLQCPFPPHQRFRKLGPKSSADAIPTANGELDEESGLPIWYRAAQKALAKTEDGDDPVVHSVLHYAATCWMRESVIEDPDEAFRKSTLQFMWGFETFFGQMGLQPRPLDPASFS